MSQCNNNAAYNFRSGINAIQTDENYEAVETHGHDVVVDGNAVHEAIVTPAVITPPASGEGSIQNTAPDLNAMFQLLMEQNHMACLLNNSLFRIQRPITNREIRL